MAVHELDYEEIRALAATIDISPDQSLGQYFTHDPQTVHRIASTCDVGASDRVLEIGSGMGALTLALLSLGARVDAVDIDPRLARQLPVTVSEHCHSEINRLSVFLHDVLSLRTSDCPDGATLALVHLPPDAMTAAVLHLLDEFTSVRTIVAIVDEAAQRWESTKPGLPGYDASVAKLRYLATVRHCGALSPSAFWPAPRRAPDLVRLDRID